MNNPQKTPVIALIGNPNSGKTTVFNALTGAKQRVGNWPGVTVERKEGQFHLSDGTPVNIVDLPGTYSLTPSSEDEKVAVEYVLSGDADLFVNIVDGTSFERNLYLSSLLAELGKPMIMVVTMMDIVEERGIKIDLEHLSRHIGAPVVGINATAGGSGLSKIFKGFRGNTSVHEATANTVGSASDVIPCIEKSLSSPAKPNLKITYPKEIEEEVSKLVSRCAQTAAEANIPPRIFALRLIEGDPVVFEIAHKSGIVDKDDLEAASARIFNTLKEFPDEVLADARYGLINGLCREIVSKAKKREFFSQKADRIILNRWLGIPFFLLVMYVVFWITQVVGGAFIDFFDILGGTIFVDGVSALLGKIGAPDYITALLADGLGAGLQTVATFLPPIFFMFLCLSILEDSGYMARAAFVMDRFMTKLGLPGKSFVPLLVGFGCSVPAIMGTRTLESKRDRFLTIFMTPFMSCSAKLPVWVVFAAAFFPENPGRLIFLIYLTGIVLGILTGLILKKTLFQGEPSHFIMELPPYHLPRIKHILLHSWDRMKIFIFRAGKVIVPMVLILGVLNTVGRDGTIGNADTENSMLSVAGKTITPIFEPMGIEEENWPATVAIFSGLFAKEAVVGTLNGLYGQNSSFFGSGSDAEEESAESAEEESFDFWGGIRDAFASIPDGISGIFSAFLDPLGFRDVSADEEAVAETVEADTSVFTNMRNSFTKGRLQVYAYLLFILLYVPCLAAMGAAFRELGRLYGCILMAYLTILGWSVATLFYQITIGHSFIWISVPAALLAAMFYSFYVMGKKRKVEFI